MALSKKLQSRFDSLADEIFDLWLRSGKPSLGMIEAGKERETIEDAPIDLDIKSKLLTALDIAESEIEWLETEGNNGKGYSMASISKQHQRYIRELLKEKSGIENYRALPNCLFTYDKTNLVNSKTQDKVEKNVEKLYPVNDEIINNWLETAIKLVKTEYQEKPANIAAIAIGLCMLTGRRPYSEVCDTLRIDLESLEIDNDNENKATITMTGLRKDKSQELLSGHNIRLFALEKGLLVYELVEKLEQVQSYIKSRVWYSSKYSRSEQAEVIQQNMHQYFTPIIQFDLMPIFKDLAEKGYPLTLSPYDCRKMAATINHWYYQKETGMSGNFHELSAKYLVHEYKDRTTGANRKNTTTTRSYVKYELSLSPSIPDRITLWCE